MSGTVICVARRRVEPRLITRRSPHDQPRRNCRPASTSSSRRSMRSNRARGSGAAQCGVLISWPEGADRCQDEAVDRRRRRSTRPRARWSDHPSPPPSPAHRRARAAVAEIRAVGHLGIRDRASPRRRPGGTDRRRATCVTRMRRVPTATTANRPASIVATCNMRGGDADVPFASRPRPLRCHDRSARHRTRARSIPGSPARVAGSEARTHAAAGPRGPGSSTVPSGNIGMIAIRSPSGRHRGASVSVLGPVGYGARA